MQRAPAVLSLLLVLLIHSGWTNGLCNLENGTVARCHELGDVKFIETYDLESLKASVTERVLSGDLFSNLSSLRHLDLSEGQLERVDPGSFRKLINLRSLDLADNHIGYLDLASFDGLNHLRSLNLRRNNLRQLPPALARLKVLRHLDVLGNPLQCNCATLRVRDLITKRGVKMSKKIFCAGPGNMKGTSLLKPDATITCQLEEQDREMQGDQAHPGSTEGKPETKHKGSVHADGEDELGSGSAADDYYYDGEYVEIHDASSEAPKEPEVETPYPETSKVTTDSSVTEKSETPSQMTSATSESPGQVSTSPKDSVDKTATDDDELFFDSDEKGRAVVATTEKKETYKDVLFYPVEESDDDEGSGEGSGTGIDSTDWTKHEEVTAGKDEEPTSSGESLFDILFSVLWNTTAAPDEKKDPDLEEEQFIDVSSTKEPKEAKEEEVITQKKTYMIEAEQPSTTEEPIKTSTMASATNGVELVDNELHDTSKLGNVKVEDEDSINDELAEVSPARQSKKGMGSYVVLAALLAILATLIGFAAYKGDFCRKKRKRGDVENGTEMKDMQKALLDTGNSTQPKISSNGNVENVPLVERTLDPEDDHRVTVDVPKQLNGNADHMDPVKPPRRIATPSDELKIDEKPRQDTNSLKDESLSARTSSIDPTVNNGSLSRPAEGNVPPLSPGAQRVKITLQENPDSVPRTPILITRTMAGENLVKTP